MCGITGYWDTSNRIEQSDLLNMLDSIHHRGPDDDGIWIDHNNGIALGHRRLSVLDLSKSGSQPMSSKEGRYIIVFNGEIYNHLSIRESLKNDGVNINWDGHSDTETLVNAIQCWGINKTLQYTVGMFAFALWDRKKQILTLARDRVGEKPLYFGYLNKVLIFASELKAIRKHHSFNNDIDRNALTLFFRHNYIPCPHTIYKDIKKLKPGTYIEFSDSGKKSKVLEYWSAREIAEKGQLNTFKGDTYEAISELQRLLSSSISSQLISDVPLGAFLSGGFDSSMVVAIMQSLSNQPVKTFSIGFNEKEYNEAHHAKNVAQHLGTDHTELYVTPEQAMAVIPELPTIYDEPFADSSQIPTYLVSKLAKQHVTVSLSGDAGDELFCGYNRYLYTIKLWKNCSSSLPTPFRAALAGMLTTLSPSAINAVFNNLWRLLPNKYRINNMGNKLHKVADILSMNSPEKIYLNLLSHWQQPSDLVINGEEPNTIITDKSLWADLPNFESTMMYLDTMSYLPDDILVKVDRAAMAVSLETRIPFLDHKLIEFAWALPLSMKIRQGESKWLLRQLLYKYVPEKIIDRPKMGFGVPIDVWLRGPLKEWAENLIDDKKLQQQGFLNPSLIHEKWKQHLSGKANWQYLLWDVLMFQSWLETT